MDISAAKMIGAGLATLALAGAGIGLGNIFSSAAAAISRNPSARKDLEPILYLGAGLTEAIALFAFVIVVLILFVAK